MNQKQKIDYYLKNNNKFNEEHKKLLQMIQMLNPTLKRIICYKQRMKNLLNYLDKEKQMLIYGNLNMRINYNRFYK